MSRYLAFVLLALSASSVLAAPAEIPELPAIPDMGTVTDPVLGARAEIPGLPIPDVGARSNKAYSPNALHKRDWQHPASTKDCHLSKVPEHATTLSYTHEGQEYSEECLTRLALSVPFENRKSCRTTGADAHGYDEQCLFKKAFEEDWKFDVEKAKQEELAWRTANPGRPASDAWRIQFPIAISDCRVIPETMDKRAANGKKEGKKGGEEKEVKGGKKGTTKTSDATSGWSRYSVIPTGETLDDECISRLVNSVGITIDLQTCPVGDASTDATDALALADLITSLFGRSTTELATRQDPAAVSVSVLVALRLGCLLDLIVKIINAVGIDAQLLEAVDDLVPELLGVVDGLLATLLG